VNQILAAIVKAVLVTFIGTVATIAVEKIRRHNEDRHENDYYHNQPQYDDYDRWN
jgi:cell division protein FtsN